MPSASFPRDLDEIDDRPPHGAAGALETIASVLALLRDEVPPTVGTSELDPRIDIAVVLKASRKTKLARPVSLSLGFGGHNACLILEKAT